jgi:hypothetical protein
VRASANIIITLAITARKQSTQKQNLTTHPCDHCGSSFLRCRYIQWMELRGEDAKVPLHKAHAFFVRGEPLMTDDEVKREKAYRFPNPLHKPKISDLTAPPRQGQMFGGSSGGSAVADSERTLLQSSPALFTGRVVFYEVLVWLERMQDKLDMSVRSPPAKEKNESNESFLARSQEYYRLVAAGEKAPLPAWGTREEMSVVVGGQLSILEHRTLHQMLTAMWRHPLGGLVHGDIMMFARRSADERVEEKRTKVDRHGLVRALGRRKDAQAKATLTPGEGIVTVNNAPLSKYFCRTIDRHEVSVVPVVPRSNSPPLAVARLLTRPNLWRVSFVC